MLKTYIKLPGGQVLSSGEATENAIVSVSYTQTVNKGQELTLGSVCAGMLEIKIFGDAHISAGDRLTVWRQDEEGNAYDLGVFFAEEPTRAGAHFLNLTAYDPVILLDREVTELLGQQALENCSQQALAEAVCDFCGLTLEGELPLGHLPVTGITGGGITGRRVLGWIGELNGLFCRATVDGQIEFAWYGENAGVKIGVSSDGDNTIGYCSGSLSFEDYAVAPIEKVQLRKTENDVGTVYPDGLEGAVNTYIVNGNPLLGAIPEEALPQIAEHLYSCLQGVTYTPCKVSIPASFAVKAGDVVQITDRNGKTITAYVMTKTQKGQKDTLECTGSYRRDSTTAVNNRSYADLQGKVMRLRTDLDGLYAEHSDTAGKAAKLELDMEGIRSQASRQEELQERISTVEQTADQVKISVDTLVSDGADKLKTSMGYTFDDQGLNIHRDGSEVTNRLDENGMQVLRDAGTAGETVMLQADAQGVIATDVKVRNYLVIGSHARLEDYGEGRTACFYLGGA